MLPTFLVLVVLFAKNDEVCRNMKKLAGKGEKRPQNGPYLLIRNSPKRHTSMPAALVIVSCSLYKK
jgi:hypothetical protein